MPGMISAPQPPAFFTAPIHQEVVVGPAEGIDALGVGGEGEVHDHHGRDDEHPEFVNVQEFTGFGFGGTGHAG